MLVQLMDNLRNVSHAVSIFDVWIYNASDKKELPLVEELLYLTCATSEDENIATEFEKVLIHSGMSTKNPRSFTRNKSYFFFPPD